MNVTDVIEEQENARQKMYLANFQEQFIQTWQPKDRRDQEDFQRELYYLIHAIYAEAQKPLMKQLNDIVGHMTMPYFITKEDMPK